MSRVAIWSAVVVLVSCGRGGAAPDAGPLPGVRSDGGTNRSLRTCPVTGPGAMEGEVCFVVTPAETGLPAEGGGATVDQYALRPTTNAKGQLLLFFNGSGGSPRAGAGASDGSFYGVARAQGLHVLAPSYLSNSAVGTLCGSDACFEPTRATILTGAFQSGAANVLTDITYEEGAFRRIVAALETLSVLDPAGGWSAFLDRSLSLDAEAAIRWEKVIVSGHSQGGGHAALIGKRQAVKRVVMLAAPCDGVGGAGASWLSSSAGYRTNPATSYFGISSMGDAICPRAPEAWQTLGMPASAQSRDAAGCPLESAHGAPLNCRQNAARWAQLLTTP